MNGHAFLVAGGESDVSAVLDVFGRKAGDGDVYVHVYRGFGVDDARALCARANLRATGAEGRLFIIVAATLTHEAQNALLKTLEEPSAGAQFCIITSAPETLLPTVRSRTQMLTVPRATEAEDELTSARAFLRASVKERLEMLAPLLEKDDNDERDTGSVVVFLAGLERALAPHVQKNPEAREGVEAVYRTRKYLSDKGALAKVLLEQVALLAPVL